MPRILRICPLLCAMVLSSCQARSEGFDDPGSLDDPGGPEISPGGPVRVHAVGWHPVLSDLQTQQTWRSFVRTRFERDVIPQLAADRPNLVVLPENTLLSAGFIGERGQTARESSTAEQALGNVLIAYAPAYAYYEPRVPPATPVGRMVGLVITDTVYRALEPFAELAVEHGIHIAVTGLVADAKTVTDPDAIAALVDEGEAGPDFAWQAIDEHVYNQTLIIGPDGQIAHAWRKGYLVPLEETQLNLTYGPLEQLRAFDLPFARTASVISKDAWMPDVLDRLALDGTALMLQPEAFSGWGIPHGEGAWAPDVVKESGWAHVMRYPEFQASVLPCWNLNLFELVFDCQSSVLAQPRHTDGRGAWIGQDPDVGFAAVAPWATEDDGVGTLEERRARLIEHGERLASGSGDPVENMYADATATFDLDLSRPWPSREAHPDEMPLSDVDAGEQRRPALVETDDGAFVVWEDTRKGQTRLYGAIMRLRDSKLEIGPSHMRVETSGEPRRPRLAASGSMVHMVWQERATEHDVVRYARSSDGGRSFPSTQTASTDGTWAWTPDIAVDEEGAAWMAWIEAGDDGARVTIAAEDDGHVPPGNPIEPAPDQPYTTRANQHLPSITVHRGEVTVAWTDFRNYRWEIWASRGQGSSAPPFRVDDAMVEHETIHSDPRVVSSGDDVAVIWTDLRVRHPDYDVRSSILGGPSRPLAATDSSGRPQWRPAIAAQGTTVVAVWQDMRGDHQALRYAISTDGGASFDEDRALFDPDDEVDRYNPEIVLLDGNVVVVYETTASGRRRVAARLVR